MTSQALNSLRDHWPEYLIEAAGLGLFMISAGAIATLLEYPQSAIHHAIADPLLRRALMGLAMGATLAGLVYFALGSAVGSAFQSSGDVDVLQARQSGNVGRGFLHRRAAGRRACRRSFAVRRNRRSFWPAASRVRGHHSGACRSPRGV